ncbi:uncharacterized protein LOC134830033 isoform X2 [Culicoides brevitarsis]|uniref:uncharacterized protein LOC134830033 isoform X2 n=1 Tax=Culicoides brevitarsis TaxID=469753 RepID=UPI00307C6CB1
MQRDPDSTQTAMNQADQVRFAKPCPGEVSDVMPNEDVIDSTVAALEPSRFFIRTYDNEGNFKGEFGLKKHSPVYVGRALGCQIDLVEPSISRRHCAFQYKDLVIDAMGKSNSGFMIYDLKSSHGTFLNGKRIPSMENIKLEHNDKITLGLSSTVFKFWDSEHDASSTTSKKNSVDEAMLAQQPSSTSQPEEPTRSDDGYFDRYMKALDKLIDITKEFEDNSIQVPENHKKLAKKFMQQNVKTLSQSLAMSTLLSELLSTDNAASSMSSPDVSPSKRGRKRQNVDTSSHTDSPIVEPSEPAPPPAQQTRKRGRRSKKQMEADAAVQKQSSKSLANEVQKQIQENSVRTEDPNENLYKSTNSFGMLLDENDPLAIINGPLLQTNDEEFVQKAPLVVPAPPLVEFPASTRGKRQIKPPKKFLPDEFETYSHGADDKQTTDIPKKRRGRQAKAAAIVQQPILPPEPLAGPTNVVAETPPPPEQVIRKRGRRPKSQISPIMSNGLAVSSPIVDEIAPVAEIVEKPEQNDDEIPAPKKRGRKSKTVLAPLQVIETNTTTSTKEELPPKKSKADATKTFTGPLLEDCDPDAFMDELPPSPPSELIAINNSAAANLNGNSFLF